MGRLLYLLKQTSYRLHLERRNRGIEYLFYPSPRFMLCSWRRRFTLCALAAPIGYDMDTGIVGRVRALQLSSKLRSVNSPLIEAYILNHYDPERKWYILVCSLHPGTYCS